MGRVCGFRTAVWFSHSSAMQRATGRRSFGIVRGTPPGVLRVRWSSMTAYWPDRASRMSTRGGPTWKIEARGGTLWPGFDADRLPEAPHLLLRLCRYNAILVSSQQSGRVLGWCVRFVCEAAAGAGAASRRGADEVRQRAQGVALCGRSLFDANERSIVLV